MKTNESLSFASFFLMIFSLYPLFLFVMYATVFHFLRTLSLMMSDKRNEREEKEMKEGKWEIRLSSSPLFFLCQSQWNWQLEIQKVFKATWKPRETICERRKKLLAKSTKKLKRGCYVGLGSTRLKLLSHAANYTRAVFLFFSVFVFVIFYNMERKTRQGKMNENKITSRRHEQGRNIKRDRIHKMYFVSVLHRG